MMVVVAGHAYACANAEECSQVAEIERGIVVRIKQSLEQVRLKRLRCVYG